MAAAWSDEQRRVLGLLGLGVLRPAPGFGGGLDPSALPPRLLAQLLRASGDAGRDPADLLAALGPEAARLPRAAAKRALWPVLRRLRRAAPGA
jgi:hypothetical protein